MRCIFVEKSGRDKWVEWDIQEFDVPFLTIGMTLATDKSLSLDTAHRIVDIQYFTDKGLYKVWLVPFDTTTNEEWYPASEWKGTQHGEN